MTMAVVSTPAKASASAPIRGTTSVGTTSPNPTICWTTQAVRRSSTERGANVHKSRSATFSSRRWPAIHRITAQLRR